MFYLVGSQKVELIIGFKQPLGRVLYILSILVSLFIEIFIKYTNALVTGLQVRGRAHRVAFFWLSAYSMAFMGSEILLFVHPEVIRLQRTDTH